MENTKVIGGYSTAIFVDPPAANFICSVCIDVFKNPHQCKNGHVFCLSCITESLESKQECPVCRTHLKVDRLASCLVIRDMIGQLQTKCLFSNCPWTGVLDAREDHVHNCKYELISCPLYKHGFCGVDCWGTVLREEKDEHVQQQLSISSEKIAKQLLQKVDVLSLEVSMFHKLMPIGKYCDNEDSEVTFNGIWKLDDKVLKCGNFLNDKPNGYCTVKTKCGTYRGIMVNGVKSGKGRMEMTNGDVYEGSFKDNRVDGYGIYWGRSFRYEGEWKGNKNHGFGTLCYKNGRKYVGEFQNNKYNGQGTLTLPNGKCLSGVFKNGEPIESTATLSSMVNTAAACDTISDVSAYDVTNAVGEN